MGTSGAFKGSGGKEAKDLRNSIAEWLGDNASTPPSLPEDSEGAAGNSGGDRPTPGAADGLGRPQPSTHLDPRALGPVLKLWNRGGDGEASGAGSNASGAGRSESSGGRSSGGMRRTVTRVSGPAGRAGALARAYTAGNRQAVEDAGLNYDELRALGDPIEVGRRITEFAFEGRPEEGVEDGEARMIVADLVDWMLDRPANKVPSPEAMVRKTVELMIAKATLHEVGSTIRAEKDVSKRRETESEIRQAAAVMAGEADVSGAGTSASAMASVIERSVAQLVTIYGESS